MARQAASSGGEAGSSLTGGPVRIDEIVADQLGTGPSADPERGDRRVAQKPRIAAHVFQAHPDRETPSIFLRGG
jgi:hypothetical protein